MQTPEKSGLSSSIFVKHDTIFSGGFLKHIFSYFRIVEDQ
jgi:hypothetical protein